MALRLIAGLLELTDKAILAFLRTDHVEDCGCTTCERLSRHALDDLKAVRWTYRKVLDTLDPGHFPGVGGDPPGTRLRELADLADQIIPEDIVPDSEDN